MSNERVMVSTYGEQAEWLTLADALLEITEAMRKERAVIVPYAGGLTLERGRNHHNFIGTKREGALLGSMARLMAASSAAEGGLHIANILSVYHVSPTPRFTSGVWYGLRSADAFDENAQSLLLALMAGQLVLPEDVRLFGAPTVNLAAISELRKQFDEGEHWSFQEALQELQDA